MRKRAENEFRVGDWRIIIRAEGDFPTPYARRRSSLLVRGCEREREMRMTFDERAKLASSVSAGAEHTDWYLAHS